MIGQLQLQHIHSIHSIQLMIFYLSCKISDLAGRVKRRESIANDEVCCIRQSLYGLLQFRTLFDNKKGLNIV